jgi:antitoxin component of MazEF toxin-antitoxin module
MPGITSAQPEAIMVKTIRKVGNSNALLLDKPILDLLGLREGGQVNLTVTDGSLVVTPVSPAVDQDKFQKSLDRVIRTRRKLLEKLSQ